MIDSRTLIVTLTLAGLVPVLSLAQQHEPTNLAERYLEALYSQDLETLSSLASDDLVFHDSTAAALPGGPWRFEGRDNVIDFFRSSVEGVDDTGFEVIRQFQAGEQSVLELTYWTHGDGAPLGAPGVQLELRVPAVTVITTRAGKVIEHQDFVDYDTLMAQVETQAAAASERADRKDADSGTVPAETVVLSDIDAIADRYLQAMWSFDYDGMASLLADDALYEDYTAEYFDVEPYVFDGKQEIIGFFRGVNASSSTQSIEPSIRYRFSSGTNVVLLIDVTVEVDGEAWGAPGKRLEGSGLTVTWLRIQNGKVTRHIDFADYETAIRQFEEQGAQR